MDHRLSPALIVEFVGTFTLVFIGVGAGAVGVGGLVGVALAFGCVVAGLIYTFGPISGTHINPAVTLAMWLAREIDATRAIAYVVAQFLGGIVGALSLGFVLRGTVWAGNGLGVTQLASGVSLGQGLVLEALLTFLLVNAILHAAVRGAAGTQAGMAIGLTLVALILMGGPVTGAGLNPARSLGPAIATGDFTDLWLYIVGPILGAVAAVVLYRSVLRPEE